MSSGPSASSPPEWPDSRTLRDAVESWAESTADAEPGLLRVGYIGSFSPAGSEEETHLDVVLVVEETDVPPADRVDMWSLSAIPVPTQPLVYTNAEWNGLVEEGGWLARKMEEEAVWVFQR